MSFVIVTSAQPGAGKTGVAAAIARHYAYRGTPVRLARIASEVEGSHAVDDAAYFAAQPFAPGSATAAAGWSDLSDEPGGLVVVEADSVEGAPAGAAVVFVARDAAPASLPEGLSPAAIVVTDVDGLSGTRSDAQEAGAPSILLGEDRVLAGFSMDEARRALNADLIVEAEPLQESCDHLVIAPISSDAGQPYFRRFDSKAVVVRFDRTDMHLAAMQADPAFLILTGGRRPNEYLFDAAGAKGIPVLLSRTDTENTVMALEGLFDRTRFQGERKLDRMVELLEQTPLFDALGR